MDLSQVHVLVVGDAMLDLYRFGRADRISPEAPVPVLQHTHDECRLGGAATVAAMCAALGAKPTLAAVVGGAADDNRASDRMRLLLQQAAVNADLLIEDPTRPTTVKERIIGIASGRHHQCLSRLDREVSTPIDGGVETRLREAIQALVAANRVDVILISDYAKGVCTASLVRDLIATGVPVFADPPRDGRWDKYRGAAALKPNRQEFAQGTGGELEHALVGDAAADDCPAARLGVETLIVTADSKGAYLRQKNAGWEHIPPEPLDLLDVTGAGDQFLAVLGCLRAAGIPWNAACVWANRASGLQVARRGCIPVTMQELDPSDLGRGDATGQGGAAS